MGALIGLDFGTSNSTLAIFEDGKARLLPLEGSAVTMPSALFFDDDTGGEHFGRDAIMRYTDGHRGRFMRSLKSVLGTGLMAESTRIKSRLVPFEEILAKFIRHVKSAAEAQLGRQITEVVMGRPVHFVDHDATADQQAQLALERIAHRAGFSHVEFELEPIAAALDYESSLSGECLAMIADIGGGTADFTVARLGPAGVRRGTGRVLANGGVHVGGNDMDRSLSVGQIMPRFGHGSRSKDLRRNLPVWPFHDLATWHRINSLSDPKTFAQLRSIVKDADRPELFSRLVSLVEHRDGHRLAGQVEAAKAGLSDAATHVCEIAGLDGAKLEFSRDAFETGIMDLVERLQNACGETLQNAGVRAEAVDAVFLTGGTTQIPVVRQMLERQFPACRFVKGDVFGSVGQGLAIAAGQAFR